MEQQVYSYPHFVANQILKSKHLNDSFGYLDEQARLTRAKLMGSGVLEGLSFSFENGILEIKPGTFVNNRGWMMQIKKTVQYKYAATVSASVRFPFNSDSIDELLTPGTKNSTTYYICFQNQEEALELGFNPVELSSLEMSDIQMISLACGVRTINRICSESSCDVSSNNQTIGFVPVLHKNLANSYPAYSLKLISYRALQKCSVSTSKSIKSYWNQQFFASELKNQFVRERTKTLQEGSYLWVTLLGQTQGLDSNVKAGVFYGLFPDYKPLLCRFRNALHKIRAMKANPETLHIPDYFLFFLEDIRFAIWDFFHDYCQFALRYPYVPNMMFANNALVYLGSLNAEKNAQSRSLFFNINDETVRRDILRLHDLLERIVVISESFIGSVMNQGKVHPREVGIHVESPYSSLSARPIPAYYQQCESLLRLWHIDDYFSVVRKSDYPNKKDEDYLTQQKSDSSSSKKLALKAVSLPKPDDYAYLSGYNNFPDMNCRFVVGNSQSSQISSYSPVVLRRYKLSKKHIAFLRDVFFGEKMAKFFLKSATAVFKKRLGQNRFPREYDKLLCFNKLLVKMFENYSDYANALDQIAQKCAPEKDVFTIFKGTSITEYGRKELLIDYDLDDFLKTYFSELTNYIYKTDRSLIVGDTNHFRQIMTASYIAFRNYMTQDQIMESSLGFLSGGIIKGLGISVIYAETNKGKTMISYATGVALKR